MTNLVALAGFVGFLCLGVVVCAVRHRAGSGPTTQRVTSLFVGYMLLVSLTAGFSQRDLWPFSSWRLMVGDAPSGIGTDPDPAVLRIVGVDSLGDEHRIDYRSWQPLGIEELSAWLLRRFSDLPAGEQDAVSAYLLEKANEGRRTAASGRRPGSFERWWGPFATPYHLAHPRIWSDPELVPRIEFEGLRLYREHYALEDFHRGEPVRLELVHEYRRTPP